MKPTPTRNAVLAARANSAERENAQLRELIGVEPRTYAEVQEELAGYRRAFALEHERAKAAETLAEASEHRAERSAASLEELAKVAGSAICLATLDTLEGEAPAVPPSHALTVAVWELIQARDAARSEVIRMREDHGTAVLRRRLHEAHEREKVLGQHLAHIRLIIARLPTSTQAAIAADSAPVAAPPAE